MFFRFYHRYHVYLRLHLTFQKVLKMVRQTLVQYYTYIFILNTRWQVSFIVAMEIRDYLEPIQTSIMELFLEK